MTCHVVTFDWWGTLYTYKDAKEIRLVMLDETFKKFGAERPAEQLLPVYNDTVLYQDHVWRSGQVYQSEQWLTRLLDHLDIILPEAAFSALLKGMEEAILAAPPLIIPGAAELLADLYANKVKIGLISDTGLTIGRTMRQILAKDGLLPYFSAFVFSDESGVTKPHPLAFRRALLQLGATPSKAVHVGDLPETDICGAKRVGMRAVLYTGNSKRQDSDSIADAIVENYNDLRPVFREWGLLP